MGKANPCLPHPLPMWPVPSSQSPGCQAALRPLPGLSVCAFTTTLQAFFLQFPPSCLHIAPFLLPSITCTKDTVLLRVSSALRPASTPIKAPAHPLLLEHSLPSSVSCQCLHAGNYSWFSTSPSHCPAPLLPTL